MKPLAIALLALIVAAAMPAARAQTAATTAGDYARSSFKVASSAYKVGYYGVAARRWLRLARANNAAAQYNIGLMRFYGQGVAKDRVDAYKWFLIAETNGIEKARTALQRVSHLLSPLQIRDAEKRARAWLNGRPN